MSRFHLSLPSYITILAHRVEEVKIDYSYSPYRYKAPHGNTVWTCEEIEKEVQLRAYVQEDWNFIDSSWSNSFYKGSSFRSLISKRDFEAFHKPTRDRLFQRPTATILVAASKHTPGIILGWIAVEKIQSLFIIHYIYIKAAFKHSGLARYLLDSILKHKPKTICFTHITERAERILKRDEFHNFYYQPEFT